MPDYTPGDDTKLSSALIQNMTTQTSIYLNLILENAPPSNSTYMDVDTGTAGLAFLFLRLYANTNSTSLKSKYLSLATLYIDTSLETIPVTPTTAIGFIASYIGTYTLASIIYDLKGEFNKSQQYLSVVISAFDTTSVSTVPDPQDSGKAGLLYAAYFLNDYFKSDVISRKLIIKVGYELLVSGVKYGNESCMIWPNTIFPDILFWGEGHGSTGVLYRLLDIPEILANTTANSLIKNTLDCLLTLQFPDGNFPTPLQPPYPLQPDVLLQWCHGAPSFMPLFVKAWTIYNDSRYLESAQRAADAVWERGLLTKGLMLCHGISGNTYLFFNMYRYTNDLKYLYRAIKFQEYVLSHSVLSDPTEMRQPTPTPYAFFIGSYCGSIVLWSDMMTNINNTRMPAFELGI